MKVLLKYADGNIRGKADYTRWNNAKTWQRVIGFFFRSYKRRFIDMVGFRVRCNKCGGHLTISITGGVHCWKNECNK